MPTQIITSESNEKLKIFKSLLTSKGIKEHKKFIVSGEKLIEEYFEQNLMRFKVSSIVFDKDQWPAYLEDSSANKELQKIVIPSSVFKDLDVVGTHSPLLVLEFKDFEIKNFEKSPIDLELICPLGDPRNLGALVRSAVGLGVHEIILTKEAAHPYLPQSVKASAGAILYANFTKTDFTLNEIPVVSENYALDLSGKNLASVKWPQNLRLWVGEEGPGLNLSASQIKSIQKISIPIHRVESLNAMVSTTLAIWEWKKSKS